jgi:hypothetical protein
VWTNYKLLLVLIVKNNEDQWTVSVRNEEVLHTVKEKRNIVLTIKRRNANCVQTVFSNKLLKKR